MIEVNVVNFKQETSTGLVLLDFSAKWCGPCRVLAPVLEQLTGVKVCKIDIEESPEIAQEYEVMAIPKLVFLKDGKVVPHKSIVGIQKLTVLQSYVDALNIVDEVKDAS